MSQFAERHSVGLWWYRRDLWITDDSYSVQRLGDGSWECWIFGNFGAYPLILSDELIDHQIVNVWELDLEKGWYQ